MLPIQRAKTISCGLLAGSQHFIPVPGGKEQGLGLALGILQYFAPKRFIE
jgi:hypothetical protein